MKNYKQYALKSLKKAGLKITKQRQMIVELLEKTDKALSPYDMRNTLKKQKINADVVTIYRILETLEKLSLAHKVLALNGYIRCNTEELGKGQRGPAGVSAEVMETPQGSRMGNKNFCHHYLLCKNCHKVDEVEGEDLSKLEQKIEHGKKFLIDSHYLEFMGLCKDCQTKLKR